jgi:hypothetical protein
LRNDSTNAAARRKSGTARGPSRFAVKHAFFVVALRLRQQGIAAPMIGGIFTSFVLEFVVYPAIYEIRRSHFGLKRDLALAPASDPQGNLS